MRTRSMVATALICVAAASVAAAAGTSSLADAVRRGDTMAVRALIKQGVDVKAADIAGTTALHAAVQANNVELASALIGAGASATARTRYGVTPLHLACVNGSAPMMTLLLKAGADANETWTYRETVLMIAARSGSADAVKTLLAHGAKVTARTESGQDALMWAAAANRAPVIQLLAEAGADVRARTEFGFTPIFFAVREGGMDAVRALVRAGADVNDSLQPAKPPIADRQEYAAIAAQGHLDGTKVPEAQADGARAFMKNSYHAPDRDSVVGVAILNAKYDIAKFLVEQGANPNAYDARGSLLHAIAFMRRPGDHFPAQGGDPAPLPQGDSLDVARALLKQGADPNVRIDWEEWPFDIDAFMTRTPLNIHVGRTYLSQVGATPYYLAAKHGDVGLMRILLEGGADPKIPTVQNITPLMAAAGLGYLEGESPGPRHLLGTSEKEALEAVTLAYEKDPDSINTAADFGKLPTFDRSGIELLYVVVPNMEKTGKTLGDLRWAGSTALHGAALRGQRDIIQFLVDKGARLDAKNALGWTPIITTGNIMIGATAKAARLEARELFVTLMTERGLEVPPDQDLAVKAAGSVVASPAK